MSGTNAAVDRTLALPRVAAALAAIVILALVLPYAAVQSLHTRRLAAADRQLEAIAALGVRLTGNPTLIPAGTQMLVGLGPPPIVQDDAWTTAAAFPLSRIMGEVGPDPWGNAYLVNIRNRRQAWVISAGPDGILQTPLTRGAVQASGDDRIVPIR
jgi:hypothetical protein